MMMTLDDEVVAVGENVEFIAAALEAAERVDILTSANFRKILAAGGNAQVITAALLGEEKVGVLTPDKAQAIFDRIIAAGENAERVVKECAVGSPSSAGFFSSAGSQMGGEPEMGDASPAQVVPG